MAGKLHVGELHLSPGEILFQVEIKADQAEHDGDGLAARAGILNRERIHDVRAEKRGAPDTAATHTTS